MEKQQKSRRLAIMEEMLEFTDHMLSHRGDMDALILGVENRQQLMDEYDLLTTTEGYEHPLTPEESEEIKRIAKIILEKDVVVNAALMQHQTETKQEMAENTRQQKVMGYMSNAISSSGSYMDFKK